MRTAFKYEVNRDAFGNKINGESGLVIEITLNKKEDEAKAFDFAHKLGKEIELNIDGLYEEESKTLTAGWYEMDREEFEELKEIYKEFKANYEYKPCSQIEKEAKAVEEIALEKAVQSLEGKQVVSKNEKEGFMVSVICAFLKGHILLLANKKHRKLFAHTVRFLQQSLKDGKISTKHKTKILALKL